MKTLVFAKGSFFRRYARVTKFYDGSYGDPEYYYTLKSVLASAGYSSVTQEIYVWSSLHKNWYHVHTIVK